MKNYAHLVAALSLSGLFSTPAVADVILPSTILDVTLLASNADQSQANSFSEFNGTIASELPTGGVSEISPDATGTASAFVTGVPNPTIITNASGPSFLGNLDASDISLEYYYEANGPADVQVPIFITGNANLEALNSASGEIIVQTNGVRFAACYEPTDPTSCTATLSGGTEDYYGSGSFPIDLGTSITSDTPYIISILVDAASGAVSSVHGTASSSSASLDPVISIDPTFEDVGEFTVDVSPDVGNSPPAVTVPEPGSLALFGISLVSLGIARRKMRT